jgi:hypothetical protein
MTYVRKLLARACGKPAVAAGDVLEPPVHLAMSHENGALVINQFKASFQGTGREPKVWDPGRIAIMCVRWDHAALVRASPSHAIGVVDACCRIADRRGCCANGRR